MGPRRPLRRGFIEVDHVFRVLWTAESMLVLQATAAIVAWSQASSPSFLSGVAGLVTGSLVFGLCGIASGRKLLLHLGAEWGKRSLLRTEVAAYAVMGMSFLIVPENSTPAWLVVHALLEGLLLAAPSPRLRRLARIHAGVMLVLALSYGGPALFALVLYLPALPLELSLRREAADARKATVRAPISPIPALKLGLVGALILLPAPLLLTWIRPPIQVTSTLTLHEPAPEQPNLDEKNRAELWENLIQLGIAVGIIVLLGMGYMMFAQKLKGSTADDETDEGGDLRFGRRGRIQREVEIPAGEGPRAEAAAIYLRYEEELHRQGVDRPAAQAPVDHADGLASGRARTAGPSVKTAANAFSRLRWQAPVPTRPELLTLRELCLDAANQLAARRPDSSPRTGADDADPRERGSNP
jgi:hypothetical protein